MLGDHGRTWPRTALALIAAGTGLRALSLAVSWNRPLDPDASEYLLLAKRYSFAHPWSASFREPLWRAAVKLVTGPWGYSAHSLRIFTTVVSIATLPIAWRLFRRLGAARGISEGVALVALAIVALSAQLVREAPRGLREDACLLLFLVIAVTLLSGPRTLRSTGSLAGAVGVLAVVRWELATFAVGLTVLFALARRVAWRVPLVAGLALVLLSGPWLLANRHRHHTLLYNSAVHATFYWKQDQSDAVRSRYATPPAVDPPIHLTWSQYYLDYLGVTGTAKRFATGYPKLAVKLLASQAVPRGAAVGTLGDDQRSRGWKATLALLGLCVVLALALVARRLRRSGPMPSVFRECAAVVVLALAPYAVLARFVEMRVVLFAVPLLALCVGIAAERLRKPAVETAPPLVYTRTTLG